jgi:hypothetical protein
MLSNAHYLQLYHNNNNNNVAEAARAFRKDLREAEREVRGRWRIDMHGNTRRYSRFADDRSHSARLAVDSYSDGE